ncbi:MAG: hypothetical protein OXQ29_15545 [Rhodospirillaceae bacterium]|nr:hypothetical protein [Rhodospirillaceae bacterium]
MIAVLLATRIVGPGVPACEATTPSSPNFQAAPFDFDPEAQAYAFVQAMADDDFQTAYEMLAPESVPIDWICAYADVGPLEDFWRHTVHEPGAPVSVEAIRVQGFMPEGDFLTVLVRVSQTKASADASMSYLDVSMLRDGRIASVTTSAAPPSMGSGSTSAPPPNADLAAFVESEISIGDPPWALGATLTMPRGTGPFPAVVLAPWDSHTDRDAAFGELKMNRDLAWGLATMGVASLRYDPRAWTHALAFARQADFTLEDEIVDDVLIAVAALRATPSIDAARIHVLAMNTSGFAGPRIAQRDPAIAGLIVFATSSDGIIEKSIRRAQILDERYFGEERQRVVRKQIQSDIAKRRAAAIAALTGGPMAVPDMTLREAYVRDLAEYRPAETARTLSVPLLILNSAKSTVLTKDEIYGWIESLSKRRHAAFRLYERGLIISGEASESETQVEERVSDELVSDITAWIEGSWPVTACANLESWFAGCRGGPDSAVREIHLDWFGGSA